MALLILGVCFVLFKPTVSGEPSIVYVGGIDVRSISGHDYKIPPSWIAKVDLEEEKVTDMFPLSDSIPVVRSLALDPTNGLIYAGGVGLYEETKAQAIEVYDLTTTQQVRSIPWEGKNEHIRVSPDGERLFVARRGKTYEPPPEKLRRTWVLDAKSGEFLQGIDFVVGHIGLMSREGNFIYQFFPGIRSIEGSEASKRIFDVNEDEFREKFTTEQEVLQSGGFQPDPHGEYGEKPFTLEYPFVRGPVNTIWIYDRETLKQIMEFKLEEELDKYNFRRIQSPRVGFHNLTPDGKYLVIPIQVEFSPDQASQGMLVVFDLEDKALKSLIPIGGQLTNVVTY